MEVAEDISGNNLCKVVISRQKIAVDRNELPGTLREFKPTDFWIGKTIIALGYKLTIDGLSEFTSYYYTVRLGIDPMETKVEVKKPKDKDTKSQLLVVLVGVTTLSLNNTNSKGYRMQIK